MQLAIIGAGVAGLAAARALQQARPDIAIRVFEKSRGLGGRAATRRRDGFVFDHGAQFIKSPSPAVAHLLQHELPADELYDIDQPVWTFDSAGGISEGDPQMNAEPKWIYRSGLNRLGKLLAEGLSVQREVRIGSVRQIEHQGEALFELLDIDHQPVAVADLLLFTPPAPQTADILAASMLDPDARDMLVAKLQRARYRRCISLALAYERPIKRPYYALVNLDRRHAISWLALEHSKGPERAPSGYSLLLPQMSAQWSLDHWETAPDHMQQVVVEQLSALLGEDLRQPLWCDVQRWRYALPDEGVQFDALHGVVPGLFFAGDYVAGQGRVHLAIESGWRVAQLIGTIGQQG